MTQSGEGRARSFGSAPSGDWRSSALCRNLVSRAWDPWDSDDRAAKPSADAQRVCDQCPVKRECLAEAIRRDEPYGTWGGLTRRQRKALVRARSRVKCPVCFGALLADRNREFVQVCYACGVSWKTHRSIISR